MEPAMNLTRRNLLERLSWAGGALAIGAPRIVSAAGPDHDWDWLTGSWDVWHRRLKKRLAGNDDWDEFAGKSSFWRLMGGLANMDENLLYLPAGTYRGMSLRAYDPSTRKWAIWWLDLRTAGKLDPPVLGGFMGDEGEFHGKDVFDDKPIDVRFRWHEVHGKRPWWDQSFSPDGKKTWETNWRNYFTRTSASATAIPRSSDEAPLPAEANDWAFLVGRWQVKNRKRVPDGSWAEFDSTLNNWTVMGGLANVADNEFHAPTGSYRGVSIRAFDTKAKVWRSWWLDGRTPHDIGTPVAGSFKDGVGTLIGEDEADGRRLQVRSQWSRVETKTPRWEQATSTDGVKWETNWEADFQRQS
jgi:hypothetical protein